MTSRKQRIEYLVTTAITFVSLFLLFFFAGTVESNLQIEDPQLLQLYGALTVAYGFSSILSGIMLAARFFAKRKLGFKIIASALSLVTAGVVMIVGFVSFIPYEIYNLVRILKTKPAEEEIHSQEE